MYSCFIHPWTTYRWNKSKSAQQRHWSLNCNLKHCSNFRLTCEPCMLRKNVLLHSDQCSKDKELMCYMNCCPQELRQNLQSKSTCIDKMLKQKQDSPEDFHLEPEFTQQRIQNFQAITPNYATYNNPGKCGQFSSRKKIGIYCCWLNVSLQNSHVETPPTMWWF